MSEAGQGRFRGATSLAIAFISLAVSSAALPDLPYVAKPNPEPAGQSGWDWFAPPVAAALPVAGAPTVAEWTRTGAPDDSLILTGDKFSNNLDLSQGKDTQFIVYGQTTVGDAVEAAALIQRLDGLKAALTLPAELPAWSTYLIWPKNALGYGYPVAVNRTDAWWIGPDKAASGETVSVYGRNLSHSGGTTLSWIYLKPAKAAVYGQWIMATSVNPYRVEFTVPAALPNGDYEVWIHNGHGGSYGWSGPLALNVTAPYVWDSGSGSTFNVNSPATFNVKSYGAKGNGVADDAAAILAACHGATDYANKPFPGSHHATVYFPAGVYMMSQGICVSSDVRYMGDGKNLTILRCNPGFLAPAKKLKNASGHLGLVVGNGGVLSNIEISDLALEDNNDFNPDIQASGNQDALIFGQWNNCDNLRLANVAVTVSTPGLECARLTATTHLSITGCTFVGGAVFLWQGSQQAIDGCNFYESDDQEEAVRPWGISDLSITGCTARDYDPSPLTGRGEGRFIAANSMYGTQSHCYIGDNATIALGPPPGDNAGEKVLCEGNYTQYSDKPKAATATAVAFNDLKTNGLASEFTAAINNNTFINRWTATIVSGKGLGQYRLITSYDGAQTITVNPAWNVAPDSTSTVIVSNAAAKWVVYHNDLEGQPDYYDTSYTAMTAIEPYGGCYEWIGDSNTIKYMNRAMDICELQQDIGSSGSEIATINPCYFNYYANNTIQSCHAGIGASSVCPTNTSGQDIGIGFLGTVLRNNTLSNITTVGAYETTNPASHPSTAPPGTMDMTVFEHNFFINVPTGFDCNFGRGVSPIKNAVLYKNTFDLGPAAFPGSIGIDFAATTLDPALRENTWAGFATTSAGPQPGPILELPVRNFNLLGTTNGGAQDALIAIWNSGSAPLDWTAVANSAWLTVTPASGTVADQNSASRATLSCNPAKLVPGVYTGVITVTGAAQTKKLMVTFTVSPPVQPGSMRPFAVPKQSERGNVEESTP